jgi:hypothetical protein
VRPNRAQFIAGPPRLDVKEAQALSVDEPMPHLRRALSDGGGQGGDTGTHVRPQAIVFINALLVILPIMAIMSIKNFEVSFELFNQFSHRCWLLGLLRSTVF